MAPLCKFVIHKIKSSVFKEKGFYRNTIQYVVRMISKYTILT